MVLYGEVWNAFLNRVYCVDNLHTKVTGNMICCIYMSQIFEGCSVVLGVHFVH